MQPQVIYLTVFESNFLLQIYKEVWYQNLLCLYLKRNPYYYYSIMSVFFLNLRISHYILHKIIFPSAYNFFNYDPYRIYSPFPIDGIKASINNGQTSFIKKQILFYIENDNFIYVRKIVLIFFLDFTKIK